LTKNGPILIVDSDRGVRAQLSRLLGRAGLATLEASSGEAALAAAHKQPPSLVLLEVGLPDVNGYEVCQELREQIDDQLPVVFLSGERTKPIDRAAGFLVGGDDYVVKPFDSDELLARVRRLLDRSGSRRPEPARTQPPDLTRRELEVLRHLAEGLRPAEIATELVISPKTVASHMQSVLAKLGVHTQAQAVARAYENGLIQTSPSGDGEAGDLKLHAVREARVDLGRVAHDL
jgi:DNA-binding NarL/FixJ family response regulator